MTALTELRAWARFQRGTHWEPPRRRAVTVRTAWVMAGIQCAAALAVLDQPVAAGMIAAAACTGVAALNRLHARQALESDHQWMRRCDDLRREALIEGDRLRAALDLSQRCPVCWTTPTDTYRPDGCPGHEALR